MRGEYVISGYAGVESDGPPPHAWGILRRSVALALDKRSTPTCVGNTRKTHRAAGAPSVHPHMRGEYPPRRSGVLSLTRSTPTCVGNTACSCTAGDRAAVHPHMRGEYIFFRTVERRRVGPPPHAWGILYHKPIPYRGQRSTPTCVGNTPGSRPSARRRAVHPHMRGEYIPVFVKMAGVGRSTPTCVGNTRSRGRS